MKIRLLYVAEIVFTELLSRGLNKRAGNIRRPLNTRFTRLSPELFRRLKPLARLTIFPQPTLEILNSFPSTMKAFSTLFFLSILFPCVASDFCDVLGCLGDNNDETVGDGLNAILAGEETPVEPVNPLYESFRVDSVGTPSFDGCKMSAPARIRYTGKNGNPDQPGEATIEGTWDWLRLFTTFNVCITGLEVTSLDFDNSPGTVLEQFARAYINDSFDDPECF